MTSIIEILAQYLGYILAAIFHHESLHSIAIAFLFVVALWALCGAAAMVAAVRLMWRSAAH